MILYIVCLLAAIFSAVLFIVIRATKSSVAGLLSKAFASLMFVLLALLTFGDKDLGEIANKNLVQTGGALLIFGLVCGMLGDIFLDLRRVVPKDAATFLKAGIGSFSLGHLFYIVSVTLFSLTLAGESFNLLIVALILLGAVIAAVVFYFLSVKVFRLNYGRYALFTGIYSFVLLFTFFYAIYLALNNQSPVPMYILPLGLGLFLASDVILSLQYFGGKPEVKYLTIINHVLYYAAQIILASFIYLM